MRRAMSPSETPLHLVWLTWFGQQESLASRQRFRLYPRVAEVESEVAARSEALARPSKPLSRIIPTRSRHYAVADNPLFASSHPVNPSFAQLAGARTVGERRWGSISYSEMERLFWIQLEMTSSSLWLMSGILAMLKRDGFQPSDPTLFNAALSSVSASLSQQARTARCCLRSSDFTSRPCPQTLYCVTSFGHSGSPRRSAFCILLRGTCLLFYDFSTRRRSSPFLRLRFALFRRRHCFCWP